jgi:hypothetical protein
VLGRDGTSCSAFFRCKNRLVAQQSQTEVHGRHQIARFLRNGDRPGAFVSRRSKNRRRRQRKRKKYEQKKLALQLPPVRKVLTFELIQELERRKHIIAEVLGESERT